MKVLTAVFTVRNRPEVTVATAADPTRVWPDAAVTVKVLPPVLMIDQSILSLIAQSLAASITAPVGTVPATAAAVVEVTIPPLIAAADTAPVTLTATGVGDSWKSYSVITSGEAPVS